MRSADARYVKGEDVTERIDPFARPSRPILAMQVDHDRVRT